MLYLFTIYIIYSLVKNIRNCQESVSKSLLFYISECLARSSTVGTALISPKDLTAEHRGLEGIGPQTGRVVVSIPMQC